MNNLPEFDADVFSADVLQALYNDFLWAAKLPQLSAEDLICSDINADQRAWLSEFIRQWEHMEEMAKQ